MRHLTLAGYLPGHGGSAMMNAVPKIT
jgi:hypothetical protein